jgi:hypothetical protein
VGYRGDRGIPVKGGQRVGGGVILFSVKRVEGVLLSSARKKDNIVSYSI